MAFHQYPLDKTFIVAAWLEALVYGVYFSGFWFSLYIDITATRRRSTHSRIMVAGSIVMFILASLHVAMNGYRLLRGFTDFQSAPGGPVGYLGVLSTWHHIFKDTLYATQSILGDAMAVYRCWILWNQEYKFVIFPFCLLLTSAISGYMVCGLYTTVDPAATVFDPRLTNWITVFYSIAVVQNIITTGLMALRLWQGEKQSTRYRLGGGSFLPILQILVESAALYLFVEILLLSLYAVNYNAQYVLLEMVTPIVGITFGLITIRITLRSQQTSPSTQDSRGFSDGSQTFGSIPLRRIAVNITTQMEDDREDGPNGSFAK